MDKKYLMWLPVAVVPLFFGGKAAITAIKKKKGITNNGIKLSEESRKSIMPVRHTPGKDIPLNDMNGSETYSDISEVPVIGDTEKESHPGTDTVNADAAVPDTGEGHLTTLGDSLEEKTIFVGPKGGKYYMNKDGKKIYLK